MSGRLSHGNWWRAVGRVSGRFTNIDTHDVLRKALIVGVASVTVALAGCGGDDADEGRDGAIAAAERAYQKAVAQGENLDVGPCIAEELPDLPDWVVDVAHDPREEVDNEPENQCQRYREGDAAHFVELTPEGEVIRAE